MSTALEQTSGSPWRKRSQEDLTIDIRELKTPRGYYFRLESESSVASEDGTESIYSLQGKDTDVVSDTSDTESKASDTHIDEYEVEFEYEVASLSGTDDVEVSTTDSEEMMLAAAAAVMCDSSLDAWVTVTDVEESDDSSDETSFGGTDFSICVQCRGENCNPLYRYCEKCFQDRKKFFPPRPRRNRRKNPINHSPKEDPVKLDTLRSCLSGLSQGSELASSQECPSLGLDKIVVPGYLQSPGTSGSLIDNKAFKRKRQSSESSLSDFEPKKPKSEHLLPDSDSAVKSTSFASTLASFSSETSGFHSEMSSSGSISLERSNSSGSDKSETELCMFCNSAPKDSIFLHTNIAHRCCCYPCAKKTLKAVKRCPICNRSVNKVVKIFTS